MSDAVEYFRTHAVEAALKARRMAHGPVRNKQRLVARMYHLLANQLAAAAGGASFPAVDNFKAVKLTRPARVSERV